MAKFNETPQFGNDPNYLGYSKEVDRAQNYQTPNKALGTLFEGIGDLVDAGVSIADNHNKELIKQDLFKGVDAIRQEAGVDLATDVASKGGSIFDGGGNVQLPPGAQSSKEEIERLTEAFQNGKLNNSYYWGRVNSLVKQVRSQYPGYREEIDQTISGIVGANPANALRSSLASEYQDTVTQARSRANSIEKFEIDKAEFLPADYHERKAQGNPYGFEEVKSIVAGKERQMYEVRKEKADLELRASKNNLTADEAESSAIFRTNEAVTALVAEAARKLGTDVFEKIKAGKPIEGAELQAFQAESAKLMFQAESVVNNILNQPFSEGGKNSYASTIKDGNRLKTIKENAVGFVKQTLDLIQNGQYGLANQNANLAKNMQEADFAKLLQSSEAARKIAAAQKLHGAALNSFLMEPEGRALLSDVGTALRNMHLAENITGESKGLTAQLDQARNPRTKKVDPMQANQIIRDVKGVLTGPNFNVEAKKNMALSAFGKSDDFISQFSDKKTVYLKMLSPEVTKSMVELKSTAPEAWEAYSKWAVTNFKTVFKAEADGVQNYITQGSDPKDPSGKGAQVKFDPKLGQFNIFVNPQYGKVSGVGGQHGVTVAPEKAFDLDHPGLRASVSSINQILGTLKPIFEANGVATTEAYVGLITGIDPKSPKEQGMLQMLWEGFKNAIVPGAKADEGKQSSKEGGGEIQLAALSLPDDDTANPLGEEAGALPFQRTARADDRINSDGSFDTTQLSGAAKGYEPILNTIAGGEAGGGGYDAVYSGWKGPTRPSNVSKMTVAGVMLAQQEGKRAGYPDNPVGRYQFVPKTLRGLVEKLNIDPAQQFSPELQDRLAVELLKERGYDDYKAGKISREQFLDNLAQEWAALQNSKGRAHYDHGGTVAAAKMLRAIEASGA